MAIAAQNPTTMMMLVAQTPTGVILGSPKTPSMYQLRDVAMVSPDKELRNVRLALFSLTPAR